MSDRRSPAQYTGDPPSQPQATPEQRKNLRQFIEKAPLYTKLEDAPWADGRRKFLPESAEGFCVRCQQTRTFSQALDITRKREAILPLTRPPMVEDTALRGGPMWPRDEFEPGIYSFSGMCTYCLEESFVVVLDVNPELRVIYKIGQRPAPWRRDANPLVRAALGSDFGLYQKARVLIGSSLGMGACAYLRRLVEDQIDPWIDRLVEFERERGASDERIKEIEDIRRGRDFGAKATAVYAIIPEPLQVQGHNPLRTLHSAYSAGMHGLSDEECLEIAQDTVEVLEHMIVHLAQTPRKHRSYVEKVKELDRQRAEWEQGWTRSL